jgi:heme/copper-type cytochrome/quinol oxidase subunit 2
MHESDLTVKIIGNQWYWSYEMPSQVEDVSDIIKFDSYMLDESMLTFGQFRLLDVDMRLILPILVHIRLLITSLDVIHSWAVPSFGIKMDACPGKLNYVPLFIQRKGVFYGQCSEICGIGHGFMPIVVQGVLPSEFLD